MTETFHSEYRGFSVYRRSGHAFRWLACRAGGPMNLRADTLAGLRQLIQKTKANE
jgi:hypothetical protein